MAFHALQICPEHHFPICVRTVPGIVPFCVSLPMSVDRVQVKLCPCWMRASSLHYYVSLFLAWMRLIWLISVLCLSSGFFLFYFKSALLGKKQQDTIAHKHCMLIFGNPTNITHTQEPTYICIHQVYIPGNCLKQNSLRLSLLFFKISWYRNNLKIIF